MRQLSLKAIFVSVLLLSANTVFANTNPASSASVFDQKAQKTATASTPALNPVPPALSVSGYYLMDVMSGNELASLNPDQKMPPASLTKLMTLYITFEALEAGRIHMTDQAPISVDAWKTGGSRMFVKPGDRVPVSDLINGVIIQSGNDACMALAEYVGGTEQNFVSLMNQQAQLLGMKNTHFMDCTGLPDPNHYTTPRDLSILSRNIILNFPQYYPLFAQKMFTYNKISQPNRNRLLWKDPSVDGLKTGHTDEAGFCLIASAKRDDTRLLSVLLGAPNDEARAQNSEDLLNYGFHFFETHKVYGQNQVIEQAPVYYGKSNKLPVGVANDLYITVPQGQYGRVNVQMQIQTPLKAPIKQNQKIGTINISLDNKNITQADLIAMNTVDKANIFARAWDRVKLAFSKTS